MANRRRNPVTVIRADGSRDTISYGAIPAALSKEVFARDGLCCRYCGFKHSSALRFHIDHVKPRYWGGVDSKANLVVACARCNLVKGTMEWKPMSRKAAQGISKPLRVYAVLRSQGLDKAEAAHRTGQYKSWATGRRKKARTAETVGKGRRR